MEFATLFFSLLAGVLSTLSPCVFPILPIIVSSALQQRWQGLAMLTLGIALSFAVTGSIISYSAVLWDFDISIIKQVSAVLLLAFGLIMLVDKLNQWFVLGSSKLTNKGNEKINTIDGSNLSGQFALGLLLGLVWTPCVGPTLGAAISFAIQGENLASTFLTMLVFGIGAGLPLLLLGLVSGKVIDRKKIMQHTQRIKKALAIFLIVIAVMILTGYDKHLETFLLSISPDWLTDLTTQF